MGELFTLFLVFLVLAVLLSAVVLPIVSLVISIRTRRLLSARVAKLEGQLSSAAVSRHLGHLTARLARLENLTEGRTVPESLEALQRDVEAQQVEPTPRPEQIPPAVSLPPTIQKPQGENLESIIGRRLIGWAAIVLILFATAFFLKYAVDNRWIGEVGRVAIGLTAGFVMNVLGLRYHRRSWKVFAQIITAGGIGLLYLSTYAAFAYYQLIPQQLAFVFLAVLIAEAAVVAVLFNAPAIAIMSLVGGFLTPLLLHSDRDQYNSFFAYLIALDIGALAVLKHWSGLRTLAFAGTHVLFWVWYSEQYQPEKRVSVVVFHIIVFAIFLTAHLIRRLVRKITTVTFEDLELLVVNPFVFFATLFFLLNSTYHNWMGVLAVGMAVVSASAAKLTFDEFKESRRDSLALIGVSITFITLAIPIQLNSNWITIAWAIEGLLLFYAALRFQSVNARLGSFALFGFAILKLVFWDTQANTRPVFTPIFNRYFLSSLFVCGCLFAAVAIHRQMKVELSNALLRTVLPLVSILMLWFVLSVETFTYFSARARIETLGENTSHLLWFGQMSLSVLWAGYAAILAAIGLLRRSSTIRWASLSLFVLSIVKAMLIDIAELQQLYRIVVLLVLGLLLLTVTWGYQKVFHHNSEPGT